MKLEGLIVEVYEPTSEQWYYGTITATTVTAVVGLVIAGQVTKLEFISTLFLEKHILLSGCHLSFQSLHDFFLKSLSICFECSKR